MAADSLLDQPVYDARQVDHLLNLPSGTATRWIDGYDRGGRHYEPVVREHTTGSEFVTWGEFVETKLLAGYRRGGAPMLLMRPAVVRLRERFQVKYPLAHVKPFLAGKELLYQVQDEVGLPSPFRLVLARSDQLLLTPTSIGFLDTVETASDDDDLIVRVRPLGLASPVVIDPQRQFGAPVVRSVPTEVIAEQFRAGDPAEMIAGLYELSTEQVEAALRYELGLAA
jgi:uncharacterized protein (DUF433 family)